MKPRVRTAGDFPTSDPFGAERLVDWGKMSESSRQETLRDANEWDVMITTGTLFPEIEPQTIRKIRTPVLLFSGAKSYPFLEMITREFGQLLPTSQTIVLPDAGHQVRFRDLEVCRRNVEALLDRFDVH